MEVNPICLDEELLSRGIRRYPDQLFEGAFHHLGFDWSMFKTDHATLMSEIHNLSTVIGEAIVNGILLQLIWRVFEDPEAEKRFLRAVFGDYAL